MTEEEFQALCHWPEHEVPVSLLGLLGAAVNQDLGRVAEQVARLANAFGWRLSSWEGEGGAEDMLDAARALAREEVERRRPRDEEALHAGLERVWRGVRGAARARGLELGAVLGARAEALAGVAPLAPRWRPPPRAPGERARFAAGALSIQGGVVCLGEERVDFGEEEVAMVAFEANVRGGEAPGEAAAGLPGYLDVCAYLDAPESFVWFQGDEVVEVHVSEDDPVGFEDSLVPAVARARSLGAFDPGAPVTPGVIGIHLLRRLLAHPASGERLSISLALVDAFIDPVLTWLAASPGARRLKTLSLSVSDGGRLPRHPLGEWFPRLQSLSLAIGPVRAPVARR